MGTVDVSEDSTDVRRLFSEVVRANARIQDALVGVEPGAAWLKDCAAELHVIADRLSVMPQVTIDADPIAIGGHDPRFGIRDRGLVPPYEVESEDERAIHGRVFFNPHFGGVGAVHGGAVALVFDDYLGRLANFPQKVMARTAYLRVDFRLPTPVGEWVRFTGEVEKIDGRKRFVRGTLTTSGVVIAEAEGLWVELLKPPV